MKTRVLNFWCGQAAIINRVLIELANANVPASTRDLVRRELIKGHRAVCEQCKSAPRAGRKP